MGKEIHFYTYEDGSSEMVHSWKETASKINEGQDIIITTQMALLSTSLFESGYSVFVHEDGREAYEIRPGHNECTKRFIRLGHNLFNLWCNNEFGEKS